LLAKLVGKLFYALVGVLPIFALLQRFGLRWFTPTVEVNLCGHATLATAAVLLYQVGNKNAT
jgi:predicted PhzF superfamily epimerase YddE/YHI9